MNSAFTLLAEIERLTGEITTATEQRDLLIKAAAQHGARQTDLVKATGLSRPNIARRTK